MPKRKPTSTRGGGRSSISRVRRRPAASRLHAKAISPNPFLALLLTVQRDVDARLSGFFAAKLDVARAQGREVVEMVSAVRDLCLRGGKRLRPALLVAGFRCADAKADLEPALEAGVALELLQSYLLIHDDWMDGDLVRRGGPAVHALLAKRFRSEHKGHASGVLAGDYAAAVGLEVLSLVDIRKERALSAVNCFAQMQLDAIAGQQLDLIGGKYDVEMAYTLKTGSYTVRGPLRLGAIMAGATPRVLGAIDRYALPMGIAFQLRDDLLNAFGDPAQTGKPFGSDVRSGKRTVLMTEAEKRARGADRSALKRAFGNAKAPESAVRRALDVVQSSGARAHVETRIDELVQQANAALKSSVTRAGMELLDGAALALTSRRA